MRFSAVAVVLLASVFSVVATHSLVKRQSGNINECQYVYIAQPPLQLNCNPFGNSRLQLVCSLFVGNEILPGRLDIAWFNTSLTDTFSPNNAQQLANVSFNIQPGQSYTSRIVVTNPVPGFYFCQPSNLLENFGLNMSTATRVENEAFYSALDPCIIGDFVNISTPQCAQLNLAVDPALNITEPAVMENISYINMTGAPVIATQPTTETTATTPTVQASTGLQVAEWIYVFIGGIALVVVVAVIAIVALVVVCYKYSKVRNKRKAKIVNGRLSTRDTRYIVSPNANGNINSTPVPNRERVLSSTSSRNHTQMTTQIHFTSRSTREDVLGQNFPPPPNNPPPVLEQRQQQPLPQDYIESETMKRPQQQTAASRNPQGISRVHYYSKLKFKKGSGNSSNVESSVVSTSSTHTYVDGAAYIHGPTKQAPPPPPPASLEVEEEEIGHTTEYLYIRRNSNVPDAPVGMQDGSSTLTGTHSSNTESREYYNQDFFTDISPDSIELELSTTIGVGGGAAANPVPRKEKRKYVNTRRHAGKKIAKSDSTKRLLSVKSVESVNSTKSQPQQHVSGGESATQSLQSSMQSNSSVETQGESEQFNPYTRMSERSTKGAVYLENEASVSEPQPRYLNWKKK